MSSTHVSQNHNALHAPHYKGAVNRDNLVVPAANGLLRYQNPDQAVVSGYRRDVIHDLQPKVTPATNFFAGTNNFFDINLPEDLDSVAKADLYLTLKNADSSDTSFNSIPSNLFSRMEVRLGSEIKETVTDVENWVAQIPYTDPWDGGRQQSSTNIDPATYKVDFDIGNGATANAVRIPVSNAITRCGVPTAALKDQASIRFYSQNASNVITNDTDFQLTDIKMRLHESRRRNDQIATAVRSPMDYRYLQPKIEEKSITLVSGSTVKTVLQNFSESDLCSHMWVLIRANSHTGLAQDNYLTIGTNVWLEDEAGQNVTNGIQWKGSDLLDFIYPDKFQNDANTAHGLYLPFCPSHDPVADFKAGAQTGVQPLSRNMKLCITSSSSATYYVTVVAMCPRHVRVENGELSIM